MALILVDERDRPLGTGEKLAVHEAGLLHRAFSVQVFDRAGRWLLQRRAAAKYHGGGLWSNTCCSHPRAGEDTLSAAHARLAFEMGFDCPLGFEYSFVYRAAIPPGVLIEHEFDHVFVGHFEGEPSPNPDEVDAWRWVAPDALGEELSAHPAHFTPWFALIHAALSRRQPGRR